MASSSFVASCVQGDLSLCSGSVRILAQAHPLAVAAFRWAWVVVQTQRQIQNPHNKILTFLNFQGAMHGSWHGCERGSQPLPTSRPPCGLCRPRSRASATQMAPTTARNAASHEVRKKGSEPFSVRSCVRSSNVWCFKTRASNRMNIESVLKSESNQES